MTLLDLLADPGLRPFEIAFAIVLGLLGLELVLNILGLSTLVDADSDFDMDVDSEIELPEGGLTAETVSALDLSEITTLEPASDNAATPPAHSWLAFEAVPTTLWLAGFLTGFALAGYLLQLGMSTITGSAIAPLIASALAAAPALWFARLCAKTIARLVPKTETTAVARRSYHRRRGVITVGTARFGQPAQVRFHDGYGNAHYLMVEPLDPKEDLPQGTEVLILRIKGGAPKAVATHTLT